jgi:UDP-GlcNAc3NAcA epimerase
VLIYGDTNSTLAGALAAVKLHIPVAHVEAGLRSFNRAMPEEINRVVADHISDVLFTPTRVAEENLLREGLPAERIVPVGDVMCDACLHYLAQSALDDELLASLQLKPSEYVLATIHRAENTDAQRRLRAIVEALGKLGADARVVMPLHPRTRGALQQAGLFESLAERVEIVHPLGYLEMLTLEKHARLIATDSGGVQKEAYFARVPCVTLRDETEWIELIESGWNRLAPPEVGEELYEVLRAAYEADPPTRYDAALYGDGRAAERIVDCLLERTDRRARSTKQAAMA